MTLKHTSIPIRYPMEFSTGMPFIIFQPFEYTCPLPSLDTIDINPPRENSKYPSVALYMPGDFTESSNATWGNEDTFQGGGGSWGSQMVGNMAKVIGEKSQKVMASTTAGLGKLPFPSDIAIFKQVDPLGFSLNFNMIPYNEAEAKNIKDICMTFKKALMPSMKSLKDLVMSFPCVWDVQFEGINGVGYDNNKTFPNMALTNCAVSYTSGTEGASVYHDGNPTQIKLALSFQSIRKFFIQG